MARKTIYFDPELQSDETFNQINKKFITLKEEDIEEMSKHLDKVY